MLCLSFSPGGYFVSAGSSDSVIRVYSFHTYSPLKICELDRHTVRCHRLNSTMMIRKTEFV